MAARPTIIGILLLFSFVLSVASYPTFPRNRAVPLARANAWFAQALNEVDSSRVEFRATVNAKGVVDQVFVRQSLSGTMTAEYLVPFEKCNNDGCPTSFRFIKVHTGSGSEVACACILEENYHDMFSAEQIDVIPAELLGATQDKQNKHHRRSEAFEPLSKNTNFTYLPPPDVDITGELLAESLAMQSQNTATIGSIRPYFQDGVLIIGVQLNGLVAATMSLNASTDLPCDGIGSDSRVELELRPKDVYNGTAQPHISDCTIVAVNMLDPLVTNYWAMNSKGSIFTLAGSNKVVNMDQLNTTESTSLILRAKQAGMGKRDESMHECTMAGQGIARRAMEKRGLSTPDPHTASMTAEACAAMKCNSNGGSPALFVPFTNTCWCKDPIYVEVDHSS